MDSRVHIAIALLAAFCAGELSGIILMLRHARPAPRKPSPRARQPLTPQRDARVIPLTRDRERRVVTR